MYGRSPDDQLGWVGVAACRGSDSVGVGKCLSCNVAIVRDAVSTNRNGSTAWTQHATPPTIIDPLTRKARRQCEP